MAVVPQVNSEVGLNGSPMGYQTADLDGNMFGMGNAQATQQAANGLNKLANISLDIQKTRDETKSIEFNNAIEKWKQDNLLDKDNGYFVKLGKDASGQTQNVMKSYDDFLKDWKSNNKVSPSMARTIEQVGISKRTNIYDLVLSHDKKQTGEWAKSEGELSIQNAITDAVSNRNNPDKIALNIKNVVDTAIWQGEIQNLDKATVDAMIVDYKSKVYQGVLDAKLQEGDLSAREFFEEHKSDINAKTHANYMGAIKREEDKYVARDMAAKIVASSRSEQEAITKAEAIKDVNMSDSVLSRVRQHYSQEEYFKNQQEKESLNNFYSKAVQVAQNGGTLSYDDIPDNLDPSVKLSLMNYVNSNGQPQTDNQIWEMLYDKQVNDAQSFAKEDLNKYKGYLSDSEYKSFMQKQEAIKSGDFYTTLKDDDKMIKEALKTAGLNHGNRWFDGSGNTKEGAFNEIKSLTREFEARKGRKITDTELQDIISSIGYKGSNGVTIYKQLEKGMNERVGFTRDVVNDFVYYQKTHDGKMPSNEEKLKIINNRLNQKVQEKKTNAQQTVSNYSYVGSTLKNINAIQAKPYEQKSTTYLADVQVPTISKQLGLKLNVTSRYRNQSGSHHGEGRAADISMSEHSAQNRIRIYEKLLPLPNVQAIGTSDPIILAKFANSPYRNKLVDERRYDRQHGTNHVNHAHITTIDMRNISNTKVTAKNGVYNL